MKRFLLVASVAVLISGVFLARAAWPDDEAAPVAATPADGPTLNGPADWHYRHSQPTHWRSCMLRP
jgi:hypothetical protein